MATATKAASSMVALDRRFDIRGFCVRADRAVGDGHVIGAALEA